MGRDSILKTKSFDFEVRIINLYKFLKKTLRIWIVPAIAKVRHFYRLIGEAEFAENRNDFKHESDIDLKEANESVESSILISPASAELRSGRQ